MNALAVCNHEVMAPSKTLFKLMAKCEGCKRRKKWPWAKMVKCCQCKKLWHPKCLLLQTRSLREANTSVTITPQLQRDCVNKVLQVPEKVMQNETYPCALGSLRVDVVTTETHSSPEVKRIVVIEPQTKLQRDCVKEILLKPGNTIRNDTFSYAPDSPRAYMVTSSRVDHGLRESGSNENSLPLISKPVRFLSLTDSPRTSQIQKRSFSDSHLCEPVYKNENYYEQKELLHRSTGIDIVQSSEINKRTISSSLTCPKMSIDDFTLLKVLGRGSYGKVMLCQHKISNKYVAIKALKKNISNKSVLRLYSEKRIFEIATENRHPFLVNMFGCFQSDTHVCFVMEYAAGGDLLGHFNSVDKFEEPKAVFYAACIVLGLQYLHEKNIIYRDMKLENLLMDIRGYIKIADYGLCKEGIGYGDRTETFCGSACYIAPELITEDSYTRSVDWWSFGIVIYAMLVGNTPFNGSDCDELFDDIAHNGVKYPDFLSLEALEIMKGLLNKKSGDRLGSSERGTEDVKEQSFFDQIVWDDLYERKVTPPYVPTFCSVDDVSYFDEEMTSQTPKLTMPEPPSPLSKEEQDLFEDFDYTADWFHKK